MEQADAVVGVEIVEQMRQFLSSGQGTPEDLVKQLSSGYRGYADMAGLCGEWLQLAGASRSEVESIVDDALKQQILDSFDSQLADKVFRDGEGEPEWLAAMVEQPKWRQLLYTLYQREPSCLLLRFAVQRIADAGYYEELAGVAPIAAANLGVFSSVLQAVGPGFKFSHLVANSQHTYLVTQAMLQLLAPSNLAWQRVSQDVSMAARTLAPADFVRRLDGLTTGAAAFPVVAQAMYGMLAAKQTNPADVLKLHSAYLRAEDAASKPPMPFLQQAEFLDLLVEDMFHPTRRINPAHADKYVELLAYATSGGDPDLASESQRVIRTTLRAVAQDVSSVTTDMLQVPVAAAGVLRWLRECFHSQSFYDKSYGVMASSRAPVHVLLLHHIAEQQPLQQLDVLDLVQDVLQRIHQHISGAEEARALTHIMDLCLALLLHGHWDQVLTVVSAWAHGPEGRALALGHFVGHLLASVQPPYSDRFFAKVHALVTSSRYVEFQAYDKSSRPEQLALFVSASGPS